MKKLNLQGKRLHLKKSTVANLNDDQMNRVFGGLGEEAKPRTSKGRNCASTRCDCPQSKLSVCTVCSEI